MQKSHWPVFTIHWHKIHRCIQTVDPDSADSMVNKRVSVELSLKKFLLNYPSKNAERLLALSLPAGWGRTFSLWKKIWFLKNSILKTLNWENIQLKNVQFEECEQDTCRKIYLITQFKVLLKRYWNVLQNSFVNDEIFS